MNPVFLDASEIPSRKGKQATEGWRAKGVREGGVGGGGEQKEKRLKQNRPIEHDVRENQPEHLKCCWQ